MKMKRKSVWRFADDSSYNYIKALYRITDKLEDELRNIEWK